MTGTDLRPPAAVVTNLPRIQILRFFAATAVVLFHSLGTGLKYFPGNSRLDIFRFGDLGVDLFFGISGFIIFLTISNREKTWPIFLRRRLGRIVPMYWLMTFVMAGLLLIPGPSRTPPPDLNYLLQSLFYVSWTADEKPLVYPGWSLEYEMFFYLMVTAALALSPHRWTRVVVAMAGLVAAGVAAQAAGVSNLAITFFTDPMQLEFALGIVAAQAVLQRKLAWPALLAIAAALVLLIAGPPSERLWRLLVAGIPGVVVVGVCAMADIRRPLRNAAKNWLVKLGDASYSSYLTHTFVISIESKILTRLSSHFPTDLAILTMTITAVLVAYGVHVFVERPITNWVKRRTAGSSRIDVPIAAGAAPEKSR